jgi:hypothetical protein
MLSFISVVAAHETREQLSHHTGLRQEASGPLAPPGLLTRCAASLGIKAGEG